VHHALTAKKQKEKEKKQRNTFKTNISSSFLRIPTKGRKHFCLHLTRRMVLFLI
jgi:hypothetical protein